MTDTHLLNIVRFLLRHDIENSHHMHAGKWERFANMSRMNYALLMQLKLRHLTHHFKGLDFWFVCHEQELFEACLRRIAAERRGNIAYRIRRFLAVQS